MEPVLVLLSRTIPHFLLDLVSSRLPWSLFISGQPGHVRIPCILSKINNNLKELISQLCFKKEPCLTSSNTAVRLSPAVLQIQDVERRANYLWQILPDTILKDMWVSIRHCSLLRYGHFLTKASLDKICEWASFQSHSLEIRILSPFSVLLSPSSLCLISKYFLDINKYCLKCDTVMSELWVGNAFVSPQVQHGFGNRYLGQ